MTAGRRSNGEGSIHQRGPRSFEGRASIKDPVTGKTQRVSFSGTSKTEVARKIRDARLKSDAGQPVRTSKRTLGDWMTQWLATNVAASDNRANSKAVSRAAVKAVLAHKIHETPLDRLTASEVEGWVADMRTRLKDPNRYWRELSKALDIALRDHLVLENVARKMDTPKREKAEVLFIEVEEFQSLIERLRTSRSKRYLRTVLLIATLGLRRGEALGLSWNDVNWRKREILVRNTLSTRESGELVLTPVKTKASRRYLPMDDDVYELLQQEQARQREEDMASGIRSTLVFTSPKGKPVDPDNFRRMVEAAGISAGIVNKVEGDSFGVHTLRHFAATQMLENGEDIASVSKMLGHSDIRVAAETYHHLSLKTKQRAVSNMSKTTGLGRHLRATGTGGSGGDVVPLRTTGG